MEIHGRNSIRSGIWEATVASLPAEMRLSAVKMALQATHETIASLAGVYC